MGKRWKIYTAGKMSGISYAEQIKWRIELTGEITGRTTAQVDFIHPPYYYNYEEHFHKSEAEILEWEMTQLNDCDVVVVNFEGINDSIGTHMELGAIQGINRFSGKHIFVIGIGDMNADLHPWIKESCMRIEPTIEDAAEYIAKYLLI